MAVTLAMDEDDSDNEFINALFGLDRGQDVLPTIVDQSVRFSTSIGGLKEHIKCLREMVIFPLMYPELFEKFKTQPAKGVLFHGPPGTGKTLLARALANECSLINGQKFTFFMRKAADCLDKYFGESEKKVRKIFETAHRMSPAIIFFDEIDALAPIRRSSENNHEASVVATLLAEMDGISNRGDIIVIGATNRPDAIDPALRRPGRFDRELYFPPPEAEARLDILKIYTKDWQPQPTEQFLKTIAEATPGYLGSDIKALCSEAVLKAVRRVYPQIYESEYKLLVDAKNVNVTVDDMVSAMSMLSPSAARSTPLPSQPLPEHIKPLLEEQLYDAYAVLRAVLPPVQVLNDRKSPVTTPSMFLVCGPCAETLLAPALMAKMEANIVKELSLMTLAKSTSEAQALISMFAECRRASGVSVLFIRDVGSVWDCLQKRNAAGVMMQLWKNQALGDSALLLAASNAPLDQLPRNLQGMFPEYKQCVYNVRQPSADEVSEFFRPMVSVIPLIPPVLESRVKPPPLPRAPIPGPTVTEEEKVKRLDEETSKIRELLMKLHKIFHENLFDNRFDKFFRPVDLKKPHFKNYLDIIKRPMDLYTILSKINMEQYFCAKEFLDDIDLICSNALEYSPDETISKKKLRLDVCGLRDIMYTAVNDDVPARLELECQIIARRRQSNGKGRGGPGSPPPAFGYYVADLSPFDGTRDVPTLDFDASNGRRRRRHASQSQLLRDHSDRKRRRSSSRQHDRKRRRSLPRQRSDRKRHHIIIDDDEDGSDNESPSRDLNIEAQPGPSAPPPSPPRAPSPPPDREPVDNDTDSNSNTQEVLINRKEMEEILNNNLKALSVLRLERLIELYGDFSRTVHAYSRTHNRLKLPQELGCILQRYLQLADNEV